MTEPKKQFLVSEKGQKRGVVLTIKEYHELLQDLKDLAIIAERKREPSEPLELAKKRLEKRWQNTGSK
ncbi:MAG: hypothetical protein HYU29_06330 [Chloroflexi bacterium]|nr:hypothetical protein [Chloroflexota bacterium]